MWNVDYALAEAKNKAIRQREEILLDSSFANLKFHRLPQILEGAGNKMCSL